MVFPIGEKYTEPGQLLLDYVGGDLNESQKSLLSIEALN